MAKKTKKTLTKGRTVSTCSLAGHDDVFVIEHGTMLRGNATGRRRESAEMTAEWRGGAGGLARTEAVLMFVETQRLEAESGQ